MLAHRLRIKESLTDDHAVSNSTTPAAAASAGAAASLAAARTSDGLAQIEHASQLRFTDDDRVHEVCRMLRSSQPLYLKLEKAPEVSELDHRLKMQLKLLNLVKRYAACVALSQDKCITMHIISVSFRSIATPTGRGMLTLASLEPFMAETLPIPPLSLSGRVPPVNSIVALDTTNAHADLTLWPDFHNGVAAALRVGPAQSSQGRSVFAKSHSHSSGKVTRNWINYNRITSEAKSGGEASHAGALNLRICFAVPFIFISETHLQALFSGWVCWDT
jgi:hypothetical protein